MTGFDLGKIAASAAANVPVPIHPRDIYNALPNKPAGYEYLRGPQEQVLESWFNQRTSRDLVVKLNTGGGKTIVGLLIAASSLNEGAGPVAYLVPDDYYLLKQVEDEAKALGIPITREPRSPAYARGKAILVDVFSRLVNGLSIFGVQGSVGKPRQVELGTVIIDDAHSCLAKAESSFTLKVPASDAAYGQVLELFKDVLGEQSPGGLLDLQSKRYSAIEQIPYWAWADRSAQVLEALHPLSGSESHKFAWPLIVDVLPSCRAVITSEALEIHPPCLPVGTLTGLAQAKRRVYLTATLAHDGVLVTDFDADAEAVANPIVPASAGDIGDRLILVPQDTHPGADEEQIRQIILAIAKRQNVVVIVPSDARAQRWTGDAALVLNKDNIRQGLEALRANAALGLVVLVNRYDGIDLPGNACHVLVIDGLPEALGGIERLDQAQLAGSTSLLTRQVQRLEQGMGRAVRSSTDHCVVILLGPRLTERLHTPAARAAFSPATRAQLELSDQVSDALEGQPLEAMWAAINQCLGRDGTWLATNRSLLAPLRYEAGKVSEVSKAVRAAFDLAERQQWRAAHAAVQPAITAAEDEAQRGYLMQQAAAYLHHVSPAEAQQLQLQANLRNRSLLRPQTGVDYERLSAPAREQGAEASSYLQAKYPSATELSIAMAAMKADLAWGKGKAATQRFERAVAELAWHIGLAGQRPEHETGRGPDDLWALGGRDFFVIEAKSGAVDTHPVVKDDAEQLSNAMDWFRGQYPGSDGTPILVNPRSEFEAQAAIPVGCRVITTERLAKLQEALGRFTLALADQDAYRDPAKVSQLLVAHGLTPEEFIKRYTVAASPKRWH